MFGKKEKRNKKVKLDIEADILASTDNATPTKVVPEIDVSNLSDDAIKRIRKAKRYQCFRMKTEMVAEIEGNKVVKADDVSEDVLGLEFTDGFGGWENFGNTWDLEKEWPFKIYQRLYTLDEEWNATLRRVVPELPMKRVK